MIIQRGDLFWCDFEPSFGHEQGRIRPCVIIQNDFGNKFSNLTIVAPITSKVFDKNFPLHVFIDKKNSSLKKDSTILLNQILTIDKRRIKGKIGALDFSIMRKVDLSIKVSLGLE